MAHLRRIQSAILAFFLLGLAWPALAMHVWSQSLPQAWSRDGRGLLIAQIAHGPEGGGSVAMLVVDTATAGVRRFALSNDFSPGDGSTPERVSLADCQARAKELASLLKDFPGVRVDGEQCRGDRHGVVQAHATGQPADHPLPFQGLELRKTPVTLELHQRGAKLCALPGSGWPQRPRGTLGPNLKVLLIEDQEFLAILASPSADLAKLARIELAAK